MKGRHLINKLAIGLAAMLTVALTYASTPLWTFTPLTATTITVPNNDTATVQYRVTNQSTRLHTLVMLPIPGITQVTTAGNCPNPFILGYQQSCILNLNINGSGLIANVDHGPIVCQQGNPNQCYQPSAINRLKISKEAGYIVGGSTFGLQGTLVLVNNGVDALTINADGPFTFATALPPGSVYSVTVQSQPTTQTCTVSNGNGIITSSNVTNIVVNCSTNTRSVGGTTSGLSAGESVVLQNNGGDNLTINSNGPFTFSMPVAQGAPYNVTVLTQPSTQTCTVNNGSGTAGLSNITNVQVTCSTNAFTIGGTISGLSGTVVLQDNGTDNLSISSNGPFTFSTPVAEGATYNVTVLTQPTVQTCTVTNGSGIVGGANVTNVQVNCTNNLTTLTTSISDLALSITGLIEYGVTGTPSSGVARVITITNTGSYPATNLTITSPTWPSGTSSSTTCGSTLAVASSCSITITPGNTPTSDGTNPCSTTGTAPVPGTIQVAASNSNTVTTNVVVLSYGCIYQSGYVYAFDDTTPNTGSVGGKAATTNEQAISGMIWSSNGAGSTTADTVFDPIYGISEVSTTAVPNPSTGQVAGQTACNGLIDGICGTNNIYIYYQNFATNAPINLSFYAAGLCKKTISGFSDWYLPALCELGYSGTGFFLGCGTSAAPILQNMQFSLVDYNNLDLLSGPHWSTTEWSANPTLAAGGEHFAAGGGSIQVINQLKSDHSGVICSRALTF